MAHLHAYTCYTVRNKYENNSSGGHGKGKQAEKTAFID